MSPSFPCRVVTEQILIRNSWLAALLPWCVYYLQLFWWDWSNDPLYRENKLNTLTKLLQVPLLCLFRKAKTIISLFGVICVVFVILAATSVGFPYVEKEAPQRFYAVVCEINHYIRQCGQLYNVYIVGISINRHFNKIFIEISNSIEKFLTA